MTSLALKSVVCCIIIFGVRKIHVCVAIYSICVLLEKNSSLLKEVGLVSPPGPINCLLPLKGMRGCDWSLWKSATTCISPANVVYSIGTLMIIYEL